jgi:putative membrane protein
MPQNTREYRLHIFFLSMVALVFLWSVIGCHDRFTWVLESFPVVIAAAILIPSYRRFRLTNLAYGLIAVHAAILLVGAHYTYAKVPLFDWIRDAFHLSRNHYDRVGHFAQGFIPAVIAREVLVRKSPLQKGGWLFFLVVCVCLAISALYELLEWQTAVISGDNAVAFLATQGDEWDTQKDMALCLVGAVSALLMLGGVHDKQLKSVLEESGAD